MHLHQSVGFLDGFLVVVGLFVVLGRGFRDGRGGRGGRGDRVVVCTPAEPQFWGIQLVRASVKFVTKPVSHSSWRLLGQLCLLAS